MLKLVYDIKCGFKELYVVEKNLEIDLSSLVKSTNKTLTTDPDAIADKVPTISEKQVYESCKDDPEMIFDQFPGLEEMEDEADSIYYGKKYFKDIFKKQHIFPGYIRRFNMRLVYDDNELKRHEDNVIIKDSLKANEVMAILGVSRQTLCNYVKRGLIKIDTNYTGKQYRYNRDSVLALKK